VRRITCALFAVFAACANEPARVFVPGHAYTESIRVWTEQGESASVRVGDPLVLHAERRSGPWIEVDHDSLPPGACWWTSAPTFEQEVAGTLKWTAEPSEPAVFNTNLRLDGSREVRFTRPGTYTLTPESSGWCGEPYEGNALRVAVMAR
jgi:hypothetical protein